MSAIKEAPTDVLCKAAGTLQKAHDHIESVGFDIMSYGRWSGGRYPTCYIGATRFSAADEAEFSHEHDNWYGKFRDEHVPIALAALDAAAAEMGGKRQEGRNYPGGLAESYGMDGHATQQEALEVHRLALREFYTELGKRKDLPA